MAVVGIIGGSFDPIHYGHLRLAEEARQYWPLDRLLFIPAGLSPLKLDTAPASPDHRLEMTRLAIADRVDAEVSALELNRAGPSFMVETLETLSAEKPNDEFVLVLGMDAFETFTRWKNWRRIVELANLFVGSRPSQALIDPKALFSIESPDSVCYHEQGESVDAGPKFKSGKSLRFFETTPLEISSTALRADLRRGHSIKYLTPPSVETYIQEHKLYQS